MNCVVLAHRTQLTGDRRRTPPGRGSPAGAAPSRQVGRRSTMGIIHASGALKKFLKARSSGASDEELKALRSAAAAEAAHPNNQLRARSRARTEPRGGVVIDLAHFKVGADKSPIG